MRPSSLNPLFAPATSLKGIGPRLDKALRKLFDLDNAAPTVRDLLFHLPSGFVDRRHRPAIAALPHAGIVTVDVEVKAHHPAPPGGRGPYRVQVADGTGELSLVFFKASQTWILDQLPVGARRLISGRVDWFRDRPQIVHPDFIVSPDDVAAMPQVEPVYPMTAGLTSRILRRAVTQALERLPSLPEWQDDALLKREGWPRFDDALRAIHNPGDAADLAEESPMRRRLAYDEILASQLALALIRASYRKGSGHSRRAAGKLAERIRKALPFALTGSQEQALSEIGVDLQAPTRMLRLIQGDVGSGKTVVALLAMAHVAESGAQAVLMAPTEILARQHFATIAPLAEAAGLDCRLLVGKTGKSRRLDTLHRIATGETQLIVGTHALFQSDVTFADLGLAVVDEQHRFGVHQRLALGAKGAGADMLVMTATPIPRTLVLSCFGDMDVSVLTDKPAGRRPIETRVVPLDRLAEVVTRIEAASRRGARIYWICPLVEESEALDVAAAEDRYGALGKVFGDRVGLVHGRMKADEKAAVMARFRDGDLAVLVATTVIEVGVDVPEASIIVVEHAERFGLSQLHQLRGRVGRGDAESSCLLLYKPPLGEVARARLSVMRETDDGFRIAEEDLRLRGAGDLLGTRQSGAARFRIARPQADADLLAIARDDARLVLARDPDFSTRRSDALRILLYLFGRDEAVRLMRAG